MARSRNPGTPSRDGNVWRFPNGRTVPVVSGGDGPVDEPADEPPADEPPADEPPAGEPPADEPPADEPPADGGKGSKEAVLADLARERKARQAAEARLAELEEANKTESEKALDQARRDGESEADKRWRERYGRAAVRAAAAGKFADVEDAVSGIADDVPFTDEGDIDDKALVAKLDDLLERKPHWATAAPGTPPVPRGPQGGGNTDPDPSEMSMDEYRKHRGRKSA